MNNATSTALVEFISKLDVPTHELVGIFQSVLNERVNANPPLNPTDPDDPTRDVEWAGRSGVETFVFDDIDYHGSPTKSAVSFSDYDDDED